MALDRSPDLYCTNGDQRDISVILFQNQPGWLSRSGFKVCLLLAMVQWSKTILSNFIRGSPIEYSCEIIYKSV